MSLSPYSPTHCHTASRNDCCAFRIDSGQAHLQVRLSAMVKIPHNAFVFGGDGRKALLLRNEGDANLLNLKTKQVFTDQNPPTLEQGTDRPGRAFSSVGAVRSSVSQTDWHQLEEHRFAAEVAAMLERTVRDRRVETLVVVAPPRALADLRKAPRDEKANYRRDRQGSHQTSDRSDREASRCVTSFPFNPRLAGAPASLTHPLFYFCSLRRWRLLEQ
jgi:protein required for attachment to host cells